MKTAVIIPAAGKSTRMGTQKQLMVLGKVPVLARTLAAFEGHADVDEIILATSKDVAEAIGAFGYKKGHEKIIAVTEGGSSRQESVYAALKCVSPGVDNILIHDGARPLVGWQTISDVLAYVRRGLCAASGVISKDTVKIVGEDNIVKATPDRGSTWLVQTPQGFPYEVIKEAHKRARSDGFVGTDDATLVERIGVSVYMVEGDYQNIKLTTPDDFEIAEVLLERYCLEKIEIAKALIHK